MRLYNVATGIADLYRTKINTEIDKATGKEDYKIFIVRKRAYVFLHGVFVMAADRDETFLVGDGQTEVQELPKLRVKKNGWFSGHFEEVGDNI